MIRETTRRRSGRFSTILLSGLALALLAGTGGCVDSRLKAEREQFYAENTELQQLLQAAYAARDSMALELETLRAENDQLRNTSAPVDNLAGANRFQDIEGIEVIPGAGGEVTVRVPGDVLFAPGKVDLRSGAQRTLSQIAAVLKSDYSGQTIRVEGYTDSDPIKKSKWKDNLQLSMERAAAVHRHLAKEGVPASRMYAAGFGPAQPQATKAKSRRVEIVVVQRGG